MKKIVLLSVAFLMGAAVFAQSYLIDPIPNTPGLPDIQKWNPKTGPGIRIITCEYNQMAPDAAPGIRIITCTYRQMETDSGSNTGCINGKNSQKYSDCGPGWRYIKASDQKMKPN